MNEIKPMSAQDIPYERALALPPSLELDIFMFANILQGPEDLLSEDNRGRIPALSRKYGDGQMALLMVMHELCQNSNLGVSVSPEFFAEASTKGFIVRKTPCVVWRLESAKHTGYGRSFEEALCKLLIVAKYGKN